MISSVHTYKWTITFHVQKCAHTSSVIVGDICDKLLPQVQILKLFVFNEIVLSITTAYISGNMQNSHMQVYMPLYMISYAIIYSIP